MDDNGPASEKQVSLLEKLGATLGDYPITAGEASRVIGEMISKRDAGPPTPKQLWFIRSRGHGPENLTRAEASRLISRIKATAV